MVRKQFDVDFHSEGGALTLSPDDLGTHESGWTITGEVHEDHYKWVNYFVATHPIYGRVEGDFEDAVEATSEEAFRHFFAHHPPHAWDYSDI